jgi:hypothetical protein
MSTKDCSHDDLGTPPAGEGARARIRCVARHRFVAREGSPVLLSAGGRSGRPTPTRDSDRDR